MSHRVLQRALPLLCAGFLAVPAAAQQARLVVLPIEASDGHESAAMAPVEEAFRAEVNKLGRFQLLPPSATRNLLESVKSLGLECPPGDTECLVKAGLVMEIGYIVVLRAAAAAGNLVVSAQLLDVGGGRVSGNVSRRVGSGESLAGAVRSGAIELLAPDQFVGTLEVLVSEEGATVSVDGVKRGTSPSLPPISDLAPGEHLLVVSKEGFDRAEQLVELKALETKQVAITLHATGATPVATTTLSPADAASPDDGTPADGAPEVAAPAARPLNLTLPITFGTIAVSGALVAAGTGVAAGIFDAQLNDTNIPSSDRIAARETGQIMVFASVGAGVLALAAGVAAGVTLIQ
jgi:hypothetical protein